MTPKEFFDKVVEMRELQKKYFRTRDKVILSLAKSTEREIDEEIERTKNILAQKGDKNDRKGE